MFVPAFVMAIVLWENTSSMIKTIYLLLLIKLAAYDDIFYHQDR